MTSPNLYVEVQKIREIRKQKEKQNKKPQILYSHDNPFLSDLYNLNNIKKDKVTENYIDDDRAEQELDMMLMNYNLMNFKEDANIFIKMISSKKPDHFTHRKTAEFIDNLLNEFILKNDIKFTKR